MRDLLGLTAELVAIPSVSRDEVAIAGRVEAELSGAPWLAVERFGNTIVAESSEGRHTRILVAGHLDTVPPGSGETPCVEGDTCRGVGSVDMKGGLAVMIALATSSPPADSDLTFVFYACEEVDRSENSLRMLADDHPDRLQCDAAILCEPTGCEIEAGCQGSLRMELRLSGERAHTARPWMGRNAIHRLSPLLAVVSSYEGRRPVIDGCEYRESLQAVGVSGGVAGNVVPPDAVLVLNHRFAPDRSVSAATEHVLSTLSPHVDLGGIDEARVTDATAGAPPSLDHPVIGRLAQLVGTAPRAKLGLTDVSLFAELGIAATNFGPGDPSLAHSPSEQVSRAELEAALAVMASLAGVVVA